MNQFHYLFEDVDCKVIPVKYIYIIIIDTISINSLFIIYKMFNFNQTG